MERIYHHYEKWEDFTHGFYNNISGKEKDLLIQKSVELFSDAEKTRKYMKKAIKEWPFSFEHNFTNMSMNRVAYLGQAACCIYAGVPSGATMEAWSLVKKSDQKEADKIAQELILKWEKDYAKN